MSKKVQESCAICAETYNKSTRQPVSCLFCNFESCRTCCETYLVTVPEPCCMNTSCGKPWTRRFMLENLTKTFVTKTYKEYCETRCFEKEQALLPATQTVIEEQDRVALLRKEITQLKFAWANDEARNTARKAHHDANKQIENIYYEMFKVRVSDPAQYAVLEKRRVELKAMAKKAKQDVEAFEPLKRDLLAHIDALHAQIDRPPAGPVGPAGSVAPAEAKQRRQFIRRCANSEAECRGFLSTAWKCGMCALYTCNMCHALKKEGHECNPDDVKTVELKATDTKPCPKCGVEITKTDGCDQMWCTDCHTAFSWNKGTIETKIHNPHYYEWMRRNGQEQREAGDMVCGRGLQDIRMTNVMRTVSMPAWDRFHNLLRKARHIHESEMPQYRTDHVVNNEALRIQYMRKEIDMAEFKVQLQRSSKKHEKKQEIHGILGMFVASTTDILFRCCETGVLAAAAATNSVVTRLSRVELGLPLNPSLQVTEHLATFNRIMDEMDALVLYANECLADIAKTYASVKYILDMNPLIMNVDTFRSVNARVTT